MHAVERGGAGGELPAKTCQLPEIQLCPGLFRGDNYAVFCAERQDTLRLRDWRGLCAIGADIGNSQRTEQFRADSDDDQHGRTDFGIESTFWRSGDHGGTNTANDFTEHECEPAYGYVRRKRSDRTHCVVELLRGSGGR